jgi:nicotinate phosphoribosyltransferase
LDQTRRRVKEELAMLHPTIRRFENPHSYPVGLEEKLFQLRAEQVLKMKNL